MYSLSLPALSAFSFLLSFCSLASTLPFPHFSCHFCTSTVLLCLSCRSATLATWPGRLRPCSISRLQPHPSQEHVGKCLLCSNGKHSPMKQRPTRMQRNQGAHGGDREKAEKDERNRQKSARTVRRDTSFSLLTFFSSLCSFLCCLSLFLLFLSGYRCAQCSASVRCHERGRGRCGCSCGRAKDRARLGTGSSGGEKTLAGPPRHRHCTPSSVSSFPSLRALGLALAVFVCLACACEVRKREREGGAFV